MLVRWTDFDDAFRALDLFADMRGLSGDPRRSAQPFVPHVHVGESEEAVTLTAELPGLTESDVHVSLERGVLDIRASRELTPPEGFKRRIQERCAFRFEKRFTLPDHIDTSLVEAVMKEGVLTVVLPKTEAAKPKTIPVRGA